jgi:hypothetical protein
MSLMAFGPPAEVAEVIHGIFNPRVPLRPRGFDLVEELEE